MGAQQPTDRPGAFSLIELLVVIAVIAVLIGIAMPALSRARQSAQRVACAANLRSIGQAIETYKNDNEQRFPIARYAPPPWLSGAVEPPFPQAMKAFIEPDSGVYICPSDEVVHRMTYTDDRDVQRTCGVSYQYSTILSGLRIEDTPLVRFLGLKPHEVPVMYDFDGGTFETQSGELVVVEFFHSKRNVLFADGHVDHPSPAPARVD